MCNILFNQKPAFACKGLCANCRRKTALLYESPEGRFEAVITSPAISQSYTSGFVRKNEMLLARK